MERLVGIERQGPGAQAVIVVDRGGPTLIVRVDERSGSHKRAPFVDRRVKPQIDDRVGVCLADADRDAVDRNLMIHTVVARG